MATVWAAKPAYSDAQIKARFGAGARLVRRGDGKWTIAGASPAPAASAPPPVPPAAAPAPVSFGAQAGIDSINGRISALPDLYNPQRLALYAEGGRSLLDQGFYDTATTDVAATGSDGSTSYRLVTGADGRLYREATNDINASANSRGMLFSSATREAQGASARDLNNARESFLRGLSSKQDAITGAQTEAGVGLRNDLNQAQGDYADWKASQPVPVPPAAPTTPKGAVAASPSPAGPPGPNNPRSTGVKLPGPTPPPAPPKVTHRRTGSRR